jgi:hypothetical protein
MTDAMDKRREKLEDLMYNVAVFMASKRGLSYRQIRENFEMSIDETIDLLEYQHPEVGENGQTES